MTEQNELGVYNLSVDKHLIRVWKRWARSPFH